MNFGPKRRKVGPEFILDPLKINFFGRSCLGRQGSMPPKNVKVAEDDQRLLFLLKHTHSDVALPLTIFSD